MPNMAQQFNSLRQEDYSDATEFLNIINSIDAAALVRTVVGTNGKTYVQVLFSDASVEFIGDRPDVLV